MDAWRQKHGAVNDVFNVFRLINVQCGLMWNAKAVASNIMRVMLWLCPAKAG
jgi:hypothetical protein